MRPMPIRADCAPAPPALWRRYLELTKPKVVALITFTAVVGTLLASPGLPPLDALVWGNLGIALPAASAAAINHVLDRRIDAQMARTRARPLPTGALSERQALAFAALLGVSSMGVLAFLVNLLTAVLTFLSLIGYAVVYTVWLKRATPQNIVIGGTAGAAPPVLGWAAVSDSIDPNALLLALIIFVWTPPHFWALAIARRDDYARAGIPMLPVPHGVADTRLQVTLIGRVFVEPVDARRILVAVTTRTDGASEHLFLYTASRRLTVSPRARNLQATVYYESTGGLRISPALGDYQILEFVVGPDFESHRTDGSLRGFTETLGPGH